MANKIKISRNYANRLVLGTIEAFKQRIERDSIADYISSEHFTSYLNLGWYLVQNYNEETKTIIQLLDTNSFIVLYNKVGLLAKNYAIGTWKELQESEPATLEELNNILIIGNKTPDEKIEYINGFTDDELSNNKLTFETKIQTLMDILDSKRVDNKKEEAINRLLATFNQKDRIAFVDMIKSDTDFVHNLIDKINGSQKDDMLAILGEIFIESKEINTTPKVQFNNNKDNTIEANYTYGNKNIIINMYSKSSGEIKKQNIVAPLDLVQLNYDNRVVIVPAIILLNSWINSLATPEGLFYNYDKENIEITENNKEELFEEFVKHYLGKSILQELLGNPLGFGIATIAGILIAKESLIAAAVTAIVGAGFAGANLYEGIQMLTPALQLKQSAKTSKELKQAAQAFCNAVAKIGVSIFNLLVSLIQLGEVTYKGVKIRLDNKKMNQTPPEEILKQSGYKRGKEINDYSAKVKELQKYYSDEELIFLISKQKNNNHSANVVLDELLAKNNVKQIDGMYICDGKVDGKIPLKEYKTQRKNSVHNKKSDTMTFGKYDIVKDSNNKPVKDINGNVQRAPSNYIVRAGDTTYFDMGESWELLTDEYILDSKGKQMFKMFNKPAIDDAIKSGKQIRFSHDPRNYPNTALEWEWNYIKQKLNISEIDIPKCLIPNEQDGFLYVIK